MLSQIKQHFYNPLCIRCGSFFVRPHLFCDVCFDSFLTSKINLKNRSILQPPSTTNHFYLINWISGESDTISKMVYALKSDRAVKSIQYFAKVIAASLENENVNINFDAIVALPGSKKSSCHSVILANALSMHLHRPVLDLLTKSEGATSQKDKTLIQRSETSNHHIKPRPHELFTQDDINQLKLLYVDDILTTGNTYKASRQALRDQKNATLVTLFYRPRSH
jgi:predicted amidophosphoribosyltransferase